MEPIFLIEDSFTARAATDTGKEWKKKHPDLCLSTLCFSMVSVTCKPEGKRLDDAIHNDQSPVAQRMSDNGYWDKDSKGQAVSTLTIPPEHLSSLEASRLAFCAPSPKALLIWTQLFCPNEHLLWIKNW